MLTCSEPGWTGFTDCMIEAVPKSRVGSMICVDWINGVV